MTILRFQLCATQASVFYVVTVCVCVTKCSMSEQLILQTVVPDMVVTPAFNRKIAETDCVNCGQCAAVCPTAAITIKKDLKQVWQALYAPNKRVCCTGCTSGSCCDWRRVWFKTRQKTQLVKFIPHFVCVDLILCSTQV